MIEKDEFRCICCGAPDPAETIKRLERCVVLLTGANEAQMIWNAHNRIEKALIEIKIVRNQILANVGKVI